MKTAACASKRVQRAKHENKTTKTECDASGSAKPGQVDDRGACTDEVPREAGPQRDESEASHLEPKS